MLFSICRKIFTIFLSNLDASVIPFLFAPLVMTHFLANANQNTTYMLKTLIDFDRIGSKE